MNKENIQWLLIILTTTGLIGMGALLFQQDQQLADISSQIENIQSSTQSEKIKYQDRKSWAEYLSFYEQRPLLNVQVGELDSFIRVFTYSLYEPCSVPPSEMIPCDPKTNTMIAGDLTVLSDANWNDNKDHLFYIEFGIEGPPAYFGPFYDNVSRLTQEAAQK